MVGDLGVKDDYPRALEEPLVTGPVGGGLPARERREPRDQR